MTNKIMVTGAGGFLGAHLVKQLYDEDYNVVGMYRNLSNKKYPWVSMEFDLLNQDLLKMPVNDIYFRGTSCICAKKIRWDYSGAVYDTINIINRHLQ